MMVVNGYNSGQMPVTYGTAQGSILGPLIFILYVNDIFESLDQDNSVLMYTDYTLLISKAETAKAEQKLGKMSNWCQANKLSINYGKTKFMTIKHTKIPKEPELRSTGGKVSTVHQYEYLGMILDDKLTMNEYVDVIWKKTNSEIGILAKIRRFISKKTAICIYKCMIRPHLDYIDYVIDSGSADRIQKLNNLQKKAIRRIEYSLAPENRTNIETLQEEYNIEDLKLRRKFSQNDTSGKDKNKKQGQGEISMKLRSANKIKMKDKFTSKTKVYMSPYYRGLRLWDSLPVDIQQEKDKYVFKKKLTLCKL